MTQPWLLNPYRALNTKGREKGGGHLREVWVKVEVLFLFKQNCSIVILWPWFVSFCQQNWVIFQTNIMDIDFFWNRKCSLLNAMQTFTQF